MIHTFSFPTTIHFGAGSRHHVASKLKAQHCQRPLIVTDRGIAPLPFLRELCDELKREELFVEVFSNISGNPLRPQVAEGVARYHAHRADSIVGIGGGAALDVAKAIALMVHHPGDLFDYEDGKPDARPFDEPIPYWVALPTTSGTGSEVGRSSVISDEHSHLKKIIFSPRLLAKEVFADPELTLNLPAKITAATGMDALTHCVESYLAKNYHPLCDAIALEGLRLCSESLMKAVHEPQGLSARSNMMMASMMGAIAFQKGLGLTHSCAHALSTVTDMHHGLANGVMIDFALKFNIPAVPDRFCRMAETVGVTDPSPETFLQWLTSLKAEIGIPKGLKEAGVEAIHRGRLAELAQLDSCHDNNPRPCRREDFDRIFTEAFA